MRQPVCCNAATMCWHSTSARVVGISANGLAAAPNGTWRIELSLTMTALDHVPEFPDVAGPGADLERRRGYSALRAPGGVNVRRSSVKVP